MRIVDNFDMEIVKSRVLVRAIHVMNNQFGIGCNAIALAVGACCRENACHVRAVKAERTIGLPYGVGITYNITG